MSEVLQTNVFFVITSISVVILTLFACVAMWYIIRILRNIHDITNRIKRGSDLLAEDAQALRSFVQVGIIGPIVKFFSRTTAKKHSRTQKKSDVDIE